MPWLCDGRECELGWEFNELNNHIIPSERNSLDVTSKSFREKHKPWISSITCDAVIYFPWIHYYLESSIKNCFNFQIIFDEKQYWYFHYRIYRKIQVCQELPNYQLVNSHFINQVDYGVDLIVIFPKSGFPNSEEEVSHLFDSKMLDKNQKTINCRVLINFQQIEEMSLRDLMEFIENLDKGKRPDLDIPMRFSCVKMHQRFRKMEIKNEKQFGEFLANLYCVYRKIEIKMERVEHLNVLQDFNYAENSFSKICSNLEAAKDNYKSVDKNDFLKMYPVLKKLFHCYMDYIKHASDELVIIKEGNFLPGELQELTEWLRQLNGWFPMQINEQWYNCMGSVIIANDENTDNAQKLKSTERLKDTNIITSNNQIEPVIATDKIPKGTKFGFIDMSSAENNHFEDLPLLEIKCPQECSDDLRKWVCMKCGDFVRVKCTGQIFLSCSCGRKDFSHTLLTCSLCQEQEGKKSSRSSSLFIMPEIKDTCESRNEKNVNETADKLQKLLQIIDEESGNIQNALTDEEKTDREQARNEANDLLKQLLEKRVDLQKPLHVFKEWNKKKQDLNAQVNQLSDSVKSLENEFSSSQPLNAAKDRVRRGEALEPAIKEVEKQLKKNRDWLQQQLPNNPEVQTELNDINDQLNTLNQTRQNLMNKLQNDINKADELVADQNALIDKVNKLNDDAIAIHKSDDIAGKLAALVEIHHQLKLLQEKLDQLEKHADDPNSLVYNGDALNLPLIRERLTNIGQSLNEQQKDAADKLALAGISSNLDREISDLRNEVDKAERIDNDPAATEDDLRNAINGLNDSQQHVQQIDNLISQLDQNNPDAQALKNKVSNDVAQLRECLDGTRQSLADRADLLKDFNNEIDQLAANLDLIAQNSDSIKPETATLDDIDNLKKQNTNIGEKLNNLTQKLDELKPLNQPAVRHNNLIQFQKAVDEKLNQLQNTIQAENDKKQIAEAFNNELNKVEELLNEAEKAIENSPADSQILDQLGNEKLQPLNSLIADIDNQSIPNEELKKCKKALKKQAQALNDKYGKKFTNAKEQEDLLKKINDELSELEGLTGNITSTYGQPKSLSEAIEDKNALNKINQRLDQISVNKITDKPTRDSLVKRVEQIRNEVNTLNSPLAEEIKKEERLLQDGQDILEKINNLGIQVLTLGETGTPEDNLKKIGELSDNLRKLRKDAEIIDSKIQQPQEHVQHGLEGENLTGRIDQLQNNLADKKKELENQSKLAEIVPQLQLATESVQQKVANLESEIPQTLEQQEVALKDLQDEKRRLEDLLENLPEGPEGDETREQSKWNLSKITDWLKKLGDAVGEKAAALYAFLNSKKAIEDQLKVLNDDINAAEAEADSASPQGLQDKINALLAEEARIEAIRAKLSDDQINPENLDEDKRQELEQLRRVVDTASSKLQKARDQLQNKLDDAIAKEHLQADTNHCHNELANLIKQAYETINDPTVLPSYYKELADRLHNEIQNANNVINNSQNHPEIIEPLNNLIPTANDVEKLLNNRHNLWLEFIKERDIANEQLDIARKPLDEFEGQTDLRSLPVAEKQLDDLKNARTAFNSFDPTIAKLQELSEQLDPCESVYADVRYTEANCGQADQEFEEYLTDLHNEINEEKRINEALSQIASEIDRLNNELPKLSKESLVEFKEKALPALLTESDRLVEADNNARRNRRKVIRDDQPSISNLKEKLNKLSQQSNDRIQELENNEKAAMIAKAEEEISLLSQQPDIGEEAFERIHSQLEQLPENDPIVVSLTKQVADIKAKKDAMDALKRKLNDDIDATAAKLQKIEDEIIPGSAEEGKKKGKKSKKPKEIAGANRDEQIANLRHAIDDIDSQIVPKLNDIARVANENTMDVPTLPTEQQKAEELSKQLKDKLAEKEAEKSKAGKAVKNTDDLNKVIKQTAVEVPSIDPQENLENIMVKANELKKVLETIDEEPEDIQNILTDEQKADREQARNKANDLLKQLLEKRVDLQKPLHVFKEWNKKKQDLNAQVNQLSDSVKSLENEFINHRSLSAARHAVQYGEGLEPAIKEVEKQLKKNRDWLQQQLPNNPEVQTELNNINDQLTKLNEIRQNIIGKFHSDVLHETKFGFINMSSAEENQIEEDLEQLKMKCPRKCSNDLRKWICIECEDFVRGKFVGQLFLFCSCGKKSFESNLLTCSECQKKQANLNTHQSSFISLTETEKPKDDVPSAKFLRPEL